MVYYNTDSLPEPVTIWSLAVLELVMVLLDRRIRKIIDENKPGLNPERSDHSHTQYAQHAELVPEGILLFRA